MKRHTFSLFQNQLRAATVLRLHMDECIGLFAKTQHGGQLQAYFGYQYCTEQQRPSLDILNYHIHTALGAKESPIPFEPTGHSKVLPLTYRDAQNFLRRNFMRLKQESEPDCGLNYGYFHINTAQYQFEATYMDSVVRTTLTPRRGNEKHTILEPSEFFQSL